jgi:hypothetical protein
MLKAQQHYFAGKYAFSSSNYYKHERTFMRSVILAPYQSLTKTGGHAARTRERANIALLRISEAWQMTASFLTDEWCSQLAVMW